MYFVKTNEFIETLATIAVSFQILFVNFLADIQVLFFHTTLPIIGEFAFPKSRVIASWSENAIVTVHSRCGVTYVKQNLSNLDWASPCRGVKIFCFVIEGAARS